MLYKKNLFSLFLFCCFLFPSFSQNKFSKKTLKVAYFESRNFQENYSSNNVKNGYSYEYLQLLSKYTGWNYEYVYGSWSDLYNQASEGKIDIFPGLSKQNKNSSSFLFPQDFMISEKLYLYVNYLNMYKDISALNGKSIACTKNTVFEDLAQQWTKKNNIKCNFVEFENDFEGEEAVKKGECFAFACGDHFDNQISVLTPFVQIGQSDFYVALSQKDRELYTEFNEAVTKIHNFESIALKNMHEKYLSPEHDTVEIDDEEQAFIDSKDSIKVGYLNNYMPFSSKNEKGFSDGLISGLVDRIFANLGIIYKSIDYVSYDDYGQLLEDLRQKKIDVVFPVYRNPWIAEKQQVLDSEEIVPVTMNIVYKGEYSSDKTKLFAVSKNCPIQSYYLDLYYPECEKLVCDDNMESIKYLVQEKAGSSVMTNLKAEYYSKQYKFLKKIELSNKASFCFAVNREDTALLSILNKGIGLLDKTILMEDLYIYKDSQKTYTLRDYIEDHLIPFIVLMITVFVLVVTILCAYLIRSQKKQKRERLINEFKEVFLNAPENVKGGSVIVDCGSLQTVRLSLKRGIFERIDCGDWSEYTESMMKAVQNEYQDKVRQFVGIDKILSLEMDQQDSVRFETVREYKENFNLWYELTTVKRIINERQYAIFYLRDISSVVEFQIKQKKELEKALESSQKANLSKTRFLNSMSHDIRTPMNAVIGFTNLAYEQCEKKDGKYDIAQIKDYLMKILSSSSHLLSLINDILDMSRIESGKIYLKPEKCNLEAILKDVNTIVYGEIKNKKIDFKIDKVDVKNNYFMCDKLRFTQVLLNLLGNAIKFTPEKGSILFQIIQKKDDNGTNANFQIRIKDTGVGMSKEFISKAFEPFERENESYVSGINGTGLGLSISKNIVDLMHGTISIESEKYKGTEIIINLSFPVCDAPEEKVEQKTEKVSLKGLKILVAEDNAFNMEIIETVLEERGCFVTKAENGSVAVEIIKKASKEDFDLVLMDIQMPVMNGYEATKEIRKSKCPLHNLPIIAMTANAFEEDKKNALDSGMNAHLAKPVDVNLLEKELGKIKK